MSSTFHKLCQIRIAIVFLIKVPVIDITIVTPEILPTGLMFPHLFSVLNTGCYCRIIYQQLQMNNKKEKYISFYNEEVINHVKFMCFVPQFSILCSGQQLYFHQKYMYRVYRQGFVLKVQDLRYIGWFQFFSFWGQFGKIIFQSWRQ